MICNKKGLLRRIGADRERVLGSGWGMTMNAKYIKKVFEGSEDNLQ